MNHNPTPTENHRLVLGTVQLGLPYGIANKTGQPDQKAATRIIGEAYGKGVLKFDTAQGYGSSETVLQKAFSDLDIINHVKVISKFAPSIDHLNEKEMTRSLEASLKKMGLSCLYGMMIHHEKTMDHWHQGLGELFQRFVSQGKIQQIGFSVYSPERALQGLNTEGVDFIQIPGNVFDRRFETAGIWQLAREKNKDIYIRSIFLQGLLAMPMNAIPDPLNYAVSELDHFARLGKTLGLGNKETAVGFVKKAYPESCILFGAETPGQVRETIALWEKSYPEELVEQIRSEFGHVAENIVNCALWPWNELNQK